MEIIPLFETTARILNYGNSVNQLRGDSGIISKFFFDEDRTKANESGYRVYYHAYIDGGRRFILISNKRISGDGIEFIADAKVGKLGYNVPKKIMYFMGILEKKRIVKLTFGIMNGDKVILMESL